MVGNALGEEAVMEDEVMGLSELQTSVTHCILMAFMERSRTRWVLYRTAGSAISVAYHQREVPSISNGIS